MEFDSISILMHSRLTFKEFSSEFIQERSLKNFNPDFSRLSLITYLIKVKFEIILTRI